MKNQNTTPEPTATEKPEAYSRSHPSPCSAWMPMDTAPKDGTEILVWRDDCGIFIARWDAPENFLSEVECEQLGPCAEEDDWFYADFVAGGRLDSCEYPQMWMPLPSEPNVALTSADEGGVS
jgi:hypothetical protein